MATPERMIPRLNTDWRPMLTRLCLFLTLIFVTSCVGPSERKQHDFTGPDGKAITCVEPPPDVVDKSLYAKIDAALPSLKKILLARLSFEQTYQRISSEIPALHAFEVLNYRLCLAYKNGLLDKEPYLYFLEYIFPSLKQAIEHLEGDRSRKSQAQPSLVVERFKDKIGPLSAEIKNPENYGICNRDGRNVRSFNATGSLTLLLKLSKELPGDIDPNNFIARIHDVPFRDIRFTPSTTTEYRALVDFNSLKGGIESDLTWFDIIHKAKFGEKLIGRSEESFVIDTVPPPRAINIKVVRSSENYFTLAWDLGWVYA